jgi:hypothetical protein
LKLVAGEGFEPSKAEPGDLQSPPIGRSGNPPGSFFYGGRQITSIFYAGVIGYLAYFFHANIRKSDA